MKPYLYIDEKEWKHIIDTYEKDDVIEELMDAICYLTKLKQDLIKMNKKIGFIINLIILYIYNKKRQADKT